MPSSRRVGYIFCNELVAASDSLPSNKGRASLVHSLVKAYGLLDRMSQIEPEPATHLDLQVFHSSDYVSFLMEAEFLDPLSEAYQQDAEIYGLIDTYDYFFKAHRNSLSYNSDCYVFPGLRKYALWIAGASLASARSLVSGQYQIVLNWDGGRHHGKRDEASGFCHINDIVLAIMELHKRFNRVLYVDVDVHHGDGVESAFIATPRALTLSFHRHEIGFFPGTGGQFDAGIGKGRHHALNIPLRSGMRGPSFARLFQQITASAIDAYTPDAIVMQCGVDGLSLDPLGGNWNLDTTSIGDCVKTVVNAGLPTLFCGGGGYNATAAACCWTYCTSIVIEGSSVGDGVPISADLPDHDYLDQYAPEFSLFSRLGNMQDHNDSDYLDMVSEGIQTHLDIIKENSKI
ncbi:hypothetical protein BASA50_003450 [Batrachochytrium salamandrivorans]|uniref:Histone deacetylase n=1 Tax=Batrachochytrium salamandrivorans TaxID=1357716 RepID=A0ABQ8FIX6_9FUNG|nr:hypothetical protein BASA61_009471 [Batrachochytrium salamandrivorans]KAH6598943.1 hypothetical protein BASA50_003450 [Batrachochytrium salamandrivorans]